jgi:hypothetical protein
VAGGGKPFDGACHLYPSFAFDHGVCLAFVPRVRKKQTRVNPNYRYTRIENKEYTAVLYVLPYILIEKRNPPAQLVEVNSKTTKHYLIQEKRENFCLRKR